MSKQLSKARHTSRALVLGRAMHAPWNEGTRVIGRNLARSIALLCPTDIISLTHEQFQDQVTGDTTVEHVYAHVQYGAAGDYAGLPGIARQIDRILSQHRVERAHLIGLPLALSWWLKRRRVRVTTHITLTQQAYMGRLEHLRASLAWRVFDRWIDAYACTSEQIRTTLLQQGYDPRKLHVILPPLDLACYRPIERGAARQTLGIDPDTFAVVYVGTVSPLRFPAADIMRALQIASASIPRLTLEVYAPAATHDYNAAWLNNNVRQAMQGINIPVTTHLKDLSELEKATLYSAADVVLIPFAAPVAVEPPLTLLEAMACRTCVAVSPHGNRSGIVKHGDNGVTFSSPEELGAHLRALYALGPEGRDVFGAHAQHYVTTHHSFDAIAQAISRMWEAMDKRPDQRLDTAKDSDALCQR